MKKIKEIKDKMLTEKQAYTVKQMIVESIAHAWMVETDRPLDDSFKQAAVTISDNIVKNIQMALLERATFEDAIKNNKPLKKTKKVVKKIKKVKKNGRK